MILLILLLYGLTGYMGFRFVTTIHGPCRLSPCRLIGQSVLYSSHRRGV